MGTGAKKQPRLKLRRWPEFDNKLLVAVMRATMDSRMLQEAAVTTRDGLSVTSSSNFWAAVMDPLNKFLVLFRSLALYGNKSLVLYGNKFLVLYSMFGSKAGNKFLVHLGMFGGEGSVVSCKGPRHIGARCCSQRWVWQFLHWCSVRLL